MEKLLRCRDLGQDCDFEACGDTEEEAFRTIADHAKAVHGMEGLSEKYLKRLRENVSDAFCVPKGGYNPGRGNRSLF